MSRPTVFVARHGEELVRTGAGGSDSRLEDELTAKIREEWLATTHMPLNPPLTRRGRQQAKELGEEFVGKGVLHIYCSPFQRCVQTADEVSQVLGVPFKVEHGLAEWLIKPRYPTDPRTQMCSSSIHELYEACDPSYEQLVPDGGIPYPEEDDQHRERCDAVMHHLVGAGHGAAGLNFGSILLITHSNCVEPLCKALDPETQTEPMPFCSYRSVQKGMGGVWHTAKTDTFENFGSLAPASHGFLTQGHTFREPKAAVIAQPADRSQGDPNA